MYTFRTNNILLFHFYIYTFLIAFFMFKYIIPLFKYVQNAISSMLRNCKDKIKPQPGIYNIIHVTKSYLMFLSSATFFHILLYIPVI